jgi:hypothetical protein
MFVFFSKKLQKKATSAFYAMGLGNDLFQFALLVGLCVMTATFRDFRAVEAFIVVSLATLSSIHPVRPLKGGDSEAFSEGKSRLHKLFEAFLPAYWLAVDGALLSYSVWFWFVGLDRFAESSPPCPTYAFFFARVDMYGWFRKIGEALTTGLIVDFAIRLLMRFKPSRKAIDWILNHAIGPVRESRDGTRSNDIHLNDTHSNDTHSNGHQFPILSSVYFVVISLYMIFSVEFMIRWNEITGVSDFLDTGQILAFLVGFGGFITLAMELQTTERVSGSATGDSHSAVA